MGLTGDLREGEWAGHRIGLARNNWAKTLDLMIDGVSVASASRVVPHDITLRADLVEHGTTHIVTAHSEIRKVLGLPLNATDRIEVDGVDLPTRKVR